MRFQYFLAIFLKFSVSIISDTKMASGSAPAGVTGLEIRPLLPDGEMPRGGQEIGSQFITVGIQKGYK